MIFFERIIKRSKTKLLALSRANQLYLIGVFLLISGGLLSIFWESFSALLYLSGVALLAAGFILTATPFIKKLWHHPIGKVAITVTHLFVLLLATILSKGLVSISLGLPINDFPITVSFFALLLYIPAWVLVVFVISIVLMAIFYVLSFMKSLNSRFNFSAHAVGAFAIYVLIHTTLSGWHSYDKEDVASFVRLIAFYSDYQSASNYPGIRPDEKVCFHDNGIVSTAYLFNGQVSIAVRNINY